MNAAFSGLSAKESLAVIEGGAKSAERCAQERNDDELEMGHSSDTVH